MALHTQLLQIFLIVTIFINSYKSKNEKEGVFNGKKLTITEDFVGGIPDKGESYNYKVQVTFEGQFINFKPIGSNFCFIRIGSTFTKKMIKEYFTKISQSTQKKIKLYKFLVKSSEVAN